MTESDTATGGGTLGLERWVQFAYIGAALFAVWMFDHVIEALWTALAGEWVDIPMPDPSIVTASAAVLSLAVTFYLYRRQDVRQFFNEVAAELSRVTWPSRQETWAATVVVLIVSLISAVILGIFDTAWAAVTDLIYKV